MRRRTLSIGLLAIITTALAVPAGVHGSTVSIVGADENGANGTRVFAAAHGETNDLQFNGFLFDLGAPLIIGQGCLLDAGGGADCPFAVRNEIDLRDRDDRADIFDAASSVVSAGAGDDRVKSFSFNGAAVTGGPGDDVIENNADRPTIDGGPGDDHLTALGRAGATITGGLGRDVIAALESAWDFPGSNIIEAGPGDDVVTSLATREPSTIDGGLGDDRITVEPVPGVPDFAYAGFPEASFTISGGVGWDTIKGGPTRDIVDAGIGADVVDVAGGGSDTVRCGVGKDVVRHDASDTIAADCEKRILS